MQPRLFFKTSLANSSGPSGTLGKQTLSQSECAFSEATQWSLYLEGAAIFVRRRNEKRVQEVLGGFLHWKYTCVVRSVASPREIHLDKSFSTHWVHLSIKVRVQTYVAKLLPWQCFPVQNSSQSISYNYVHWRYGILRKGEIVSNPWIILSTIYIEIE